MEKTQLSTRVGKKHILPYCVCLPCEFPLLLTQNTSLLTLIVTKYVEVSHTHTNEQISDNRRRSKNSTQF